MTEPAIRTRQLVDWSSAIIAGLIAGVAFLAMNAFMVPAFLDADGSPAGFINAYGSVFLAPAVDLQPPDLKNLEAREIPLPPMESGAIETAGVGPEDSAGANNPDTVGTEPANDDGATSGDSETVGHETGGADLTASPDTVGVQRPTDRDLEVMAFEEKNRFSWTTLFAVLGVNAVVTVLLSCLLAFIIHRGGLLTGALGGAVFGFVIYLAVCAIVTWRAPVFAAAMKHWVFIVTHISFGALSGLLYELLEIEEFVPIDEATPVPKAT